MLLFRPIYQLDVLPEVLAAPDSILGLIHLGIADDAPLAAFATLNPAHKHTCSCPDQACAWQQDQLMWAANAYVDCLQMLRQVLCTDQDYIEVCKELRVFASIA